MLASLPLPPTPTCPPSDLAWRDHPAAWHQQLARIVDHRYSSFRTLRRFAVEAKQAGVSALMLVSVQKTKQCPGPWYNGLQLCDHINGSYPVEDGTLEQWQVTHGRVGEGPDSLLWTLFSLDLVACRFGGWVGLQSDQPSMWRRGPV